MRLSRPSAPAVLVASVALSLGTGAASAAEEALRIPLTPKDVPAPHSEWYGLYTHGTKVGWIHMDLSLVGTGDRAAYVKDHTSKFRFVSQGVQVEVEHSQREEFDASPPFAFRGGRQSRNQGGSVRILEIVRGAAGFEAKVTESGSTRDLAVGPVDFTLADALTPERWFQQGRSVEDHARFRAFDFERLTTSTADALTIVARKQSLASGIPTVWYEAKTVSGPSGTEATSRVDSRGTFLSLEIGGLFEGRLESEEQARDISYGGDLFVLGQATVDKPIGVAPTVSRLVVEAEGPGSDSLPSGPQQVVSRDAKSGTVTVSLGAGVGPPVRATPKEIEEGLAETVAYPTRLPEVKAMTAKAIGDAKMPREKVDRLVHFVSEFIEDAITPRRVSVQDLLKKPRGGCSEHSLLFVALARAAGIPAREVSGLMYLGDDLLTLGGHAWDEVVLDGQWVVVDPTMNETVVDGAHLALDFTGRGIGALAAYGGLSLRVLDVAHGPPPGRTR